MVVLTSMKNDMFLKLIEIVSDGWCQGAFAKDAEGDFVHVHDERTVAHCLLGAIDAVSNEHYLARAFREYLDRTTGFASIVRFNDVRGRRKEEVLQLIELVRLSEQRAAEQTQNN